MKYSEVQNEKLSLPQLTSNKVTKFIGKGIVKNLKHDRSLEIEAKIKSFYNYQNSSIMKDQFYNSEKQIQNSIAENNNGFSQKNKKNTQFLISFSFDDNYRLTYDFSENIFILETKEQNSQENTLKVTCQDAVINVSRKEEIQIEDQEIIDGYMLKLKKSQYSTIRIKLRRNYQKEFIQISFSEVIQAQNKRFEYQSQKSEKQQQQQYILETVQCFVNCYFANKLTKQIQNELLSYFFQQKYQLLIVYEIEAEMVELYEYFHEIVEKKDTQLIQKKINLFYESVNQIICWSGLNRYQHPAILGGYLIFKQ
ncbi:hypothetical protein TTHERM_00594140 (macronuclear) [Tetrahymena thermophila SB210]|uniref:Uncharacterized protein n=1 Tax=Tetrahymena thermophila (strain SB210) TaxID=312017 RepID=Q232I3_TETTS|nr:hypothetical protein TTHERM_00594140 [Tetrahymena thermophila SB210]EAR91429.1 hypothetical protein TTHERM_00594140 [Tetrahymena thermophila SB210]|eukprot:XP_001011674.1 hypothetical protein TTHERM_00594140 [Tetrahymena thermophila SB210]